MIKSAFRRGEETCSAVLTKEESCSSRFEQRLWKAWRLRRRPMFGIDVVWSMLDVETGAERRVIYVNRK